MGLVSTNYELMSNNVTFCEYDLRTGTGDLLFVDKDSNRYLFFRVRDDWDYCYVIEFKNDADDYDSFFWGHIDNGIHRSKFFRFMAFLDNPSCKWNRVDIYPRQYAYNLEGLVEETEKRIEQQLKNEQTKQ